MLTPAQICRLDPAALTATADAVEQANGTFTEATDQVDRHVTAGLAAWHSDAAEAAQVRAWRNRVVYQDVGGTVRNQVDALRDAARDMGEMRDAISSVVKSAIGAGFTVRDNGSVVAPSPQTGSAESDLILQAGLDDPAATLQAQLEPMVVAFDELDRAAAETINEITNRLATFGGEFRTQGEWNAKSIDGAADAALILSGEARIGDLRRIGQQLSSKSGVSLEYLDDLFHGLGQESLFDLFETYKRWELRGDPDAARWADGLGNGLLTLSNPAYGGSWEMVPQDIRDTLADGHSLDTLDEDTVPTFQRLDSLAAIIGEANPQYLPGPELGVELTLTAADISERKVSTLEDEHAWLNFLDESTAQTFIDIGLRNDEAAYWILTETGADGSPADFRRDEVLIPLMRRDWSDDGAALARMTDWIAADAIPEDPGDPAEVTRAERAGQAAFGLAHTLSTTSSDWNSTNNFQELMQIDNGGWREPKHSIGETNPLAVQSFAEALAPYASEMVNATDEATATYNFDEIGPVAASRVFTVLNTDPSAAAYFNGSALAQADELDRQYTLRALEGETKYSYGTYSGRLHALTEIGINGVYENDRVVNQEAIDRRNQARTDAFAVAQTIVTGFASAHPGGMVTGPLVYSTGVLISSDIINAEGAYVGHYQQVDGVDLLSTSGGTGVANSHSYNVLKTLVETNIVEVEQIPENWTDRGTLLPKTELSESQLSDDLERVVEESGVADISRFNQWVERGEKDTTDHFGGTTEMGTDLFNDVLINNALKNGIDKWEHNA